MPQAPWSASAVEARAVAALLPYAGNARTHSAEQVAQIAASILEFGFVAPVLVDERGEVIAGHGRLQAAKSLGLEIVPTIIRAGLTEAQKAAYRLADNRIALNAGWDEALLAAEVAKLQEMGGFDLALTGFDAGELDRLLAGMEPVATEPGNGPLASPAVASGDAPGNEAPADDPADAEPESPRQAVTRSGDLWLLGEHRLLCGDSTDATTVARVMGADCAALLFTSPPYGNQRDYTTGGGTDWDALMQGVFQHLDVAMRPDGQVLVNLGLIHRDSEWIPYWAGWLDWMRARGWRRFGLYTWDQGPGLPGDWNGRLAPAFEFVFHFNRQARQANKIVPCKWAGTPNKGSGLRAADGTISEYQHAGLPVQDFRIPDNVLRLTRHKGRGIETEHPAVFPVVLPEFLMRTYTDEGDVVFEPFGGSGTTILAGQRTGRRVCAIELASAYVDLAVARWRMLHPDLTVTLADDGRDYAALRAEIGLREIASLIERTARWVAPETFRLLPVWFPEHARAQPFYKGGWSAPQMNTKRSTGVSAHKVEGNVYANQALTLALGLRKAERPNWSCCHIWGVDDSTYQLSNSVVQDRRFYSCVANMVLLPTPLKAFTDSMADVKAMLRICARNLYGWQCDHDAMAGVNAALDEWTDWSSYPASWPRQPGDGKRPRGVVELTPAIKRQGEKRLDLIRQDLRLAGEFYPRKQVREVLDYWRIPYELDQPEDV